MIEKTIGVIPSRSELSSLTDKKAENFHDTKSEFESYFKQLQKDRPDDAYGGTKKSTQEPEQKLADKSEKTKKPDENKESKEDREEKGVAKKRKEKLNENEMVLLSNMASQENVDKAPDTEVNLDNLEEISQINFSEVAEVVAEPIAEQPQAELLPEQQEAVFSATDGAEFSAEALMEAQAAVSAAEVVEQPVADTKVLETLSREQLFQKLEGLVKEDVSSNEQTATEMSAAQAVASSSEKTESEMKSQDESSSQSGFSEANANEGSSLNAQSFHAGVGTDHTKNFAATMASAQKADTAQAADTDSALKEVISQARYLVTQGGGEVSVKMSPEGMGEVHLKMMLENGKLNVEMHTQDKNVQKLIQESLSDLKSSLAAHQISVEHVTLNNKISTVQDVQQSSETRSSLDSGQNSQGGGNSFAQFHNNENLANQRQSHRQSQVFQTNDLKNSIERPLNDVRKTVAHKVYQSHKAQSLNAVA